MNGHDDELIRNRRNRIILTIPVSSSTFEDREDVPGLGINASKGVEESVRDLIMLLPMAEMAVGSCDMNSDMIGIQQM